MLLNSHTPLTRAALLACALFLSACAAQTPSDAPEPTPIPGRTDPPPSPPPPPPPPVTAQEMQDGLAARPQMRAAMGASGAPYAQIAPQPAPGTVDRDNYEDFDTNPIHIVADDPVSTFSIDVDTASYKNVRRFLNQGRLPPRDAVRTVELINYFRYDYPLPANREQPFSTNVTVAPSPWAEGRQLVHIG
ncbi:MAG TPA: von Willebrand factor type A domain-containing protein, partial [Terricaulis sp.]|nr:von Willebrand factor type A domain-containing protein [Terricaulis sp.]